VPRYRAIVEGRNFLLEMDGARRRFGFFQTVFVDCADAAQAEKDAVAHVKADADLRAMTRNAADDAPTLHLDSMAELADGVPLPPQLNGRTLFPSKKWWQIWRGT